MTRRVFYSFNYSDDAWRASQVRNMGVVEGNRPATDNEWQDVSKGGDLAIKHWINQQMQGRSALVVLIGANTAGRPWINYEIEHAWNTRMGVLGIYISGLRDRVGHMSVYGRNPFDDFNLRGKLLSSIVPTFMPIGNTSQEIYASIRVNLATYIERAIAVRNAYA